MSGYRRYISLRHARARGLGKSLRSDMQIERIQMTVLESVASLRRGHGASTTHTII